MYSISFSILAFLATQATALTATFEQNNINLQNYVSASYPGFTLADHEDLGIIAHSGTNFIQGSEPQLATEKANGTLRLDTHSTYGHLRNYYIACYTPAAFTPSSYSCDTTLKATCYNKNDKLQVFTRAGKYNRDDNVMNLVDLTDFYAYYANLGYFVGDGSGAKCTRYDFSAANTDPRSFPAGFYVDDLTYSVTTA